MTSSKPLPGRSLAELRPDIANEWHPTKNGDLTPSMVTVASGKKVWWLADCGHEWDAPPTSRTVSKTGCPICQGKRVLTGVNDLATHYPEIAMEWHPTKNGDLTPYTVTSGSSKRVWWLADCGHEWEVRIGDRVKYGTGCPFCKGNLRVMPGINDLATMQPALVDEWHPTKNGDLLPSEVREFSLKKVWWLADCGHEWKTTVAHRSGGRKCPFCAGKKILIGFNDLATTDPDIADQWHPTKNGHLTPQIVSRGSDKKVWWSSHGHEWLSSISSRTTGGQGCAICSGDQIQIGVNDLATTRPDIAKMWHPTKNNDLTPRNVTAGSKKSVWWLGDCSHSWLADVMHITSGRGCAICRGLQIEIGINDLASQYPDLAAQWHPTKNGDLKPHQVTSSSAKKIWWVCDSGHEWRTGVNGRNYGATGCPGCADFGFSPSKDGWLYFLSHPTWDMQQIGISNVPESRLAQHARLGWQTIEVRGPMDGALAQALEQEALRSLRKRGAQLGIPTSAGGFDGHTEAWSVASLELESFKQLLDWIYSDESTLDLTEHLEAWTIPPKGPRPPGEKGPRPPGETRKCKVEGCDRQHHGFGLCRLHYRRWIQSGDTGPVSTVKAPNGSYTNAECSIEGCSKTPVGRGLCPMHHRRLLMTGDPGKAESSVVDPKDRICTVDGCLTPWFAKSMCELHYRRFKANGDPLVIKQGGKPRSQCSIENCGRPAAGLSYCSMHYRRFRKHGDPLQKSPKNQG